MTQTNDLHHITSDGFGFIHEMCKAAGRSGGREEPSPRELADDWFGEGEVTTFKGGSGTRRVCEFPDELLHLDRFDLDRRTHDTLYVLKFSDRPVPQNYIEATLWSEDGHSLFAPILAWDGAYRWLLMKRLTPISPVEGDLAYLQTRQEYYHDPDVGTEVEEFLEEDGYAIEDPEINAAYNEVHDIVQLMDYGGVSRKEDDVEVPAWVSATESRGE